MKFACECKLVILNICVWGGASLFWPVFIRNIVMVSFLLGSGKWINQGRVGRSKFRLHLKILGIRIVKWKWVRIFSSKVYLVILCSSGVSKNSIDLKIIKLSFFHLVLPESEHLFVKPLNYFKLQIGTSAYDATLFIVKLKKLKVEPIKYSNRQYWDSSLNSLVSFFVFCG